MSLTNKILLPALTVVFALAVVNGAVAADNEDTSKAGAILFRIEHIKPVVNEEGVTTSCTFIVTAFNRMDKGVKEAVMNFRWEDNISARYAISGDNVIAKSAQDARTVVQTSVTLADLAPHKQRSFEGKVDTNKCFLLFDSVNYKVDNCVYEGEKVEMKDSKVVSTGPSCAGNFNYINSQNPEYYSEFKDTPDSVITKQAEEEKNNELSKINASYRGVMSEFEKLNRILSEIK